MVTMVLPLALLAVMFVPPMVWRALTRGTIPARERDAHLIGWLRRPLPSISEGIDYDEAEAFAKAAVSGMDYAGGLARAVIGYLRDEIDLDGLELLLDRPEHVAGGLSPEYAVKRVMRGRFGVMLPI